MYTPCVLSVLIMALLMVLATPSPAPPTTPTPAPTPPTVIPTASPHILSTRSLRLPNDTYPLGYQLHISSNIHLGDFRFNGNATIEIQIKTSTNQIVLHAKNLTDIQITLRLLDSERPDSVGELVDDLTHTYDAGGTFLIIHPVLNYQAFEAGQRYRLEILFTAEMGTRPKGLYWMAYEETDTNQTTYVAATQSEPTYARLIFPCYDEPAFKSNFTIKLTHSNKLMSVSNMPVDRIVHHGELMTTTFLPTPPMSTYLVAFVISNFKHISETYRGITQSLYFSPTNNVTGGSLLKNAIQTVASLEDYFGVSYTLPKLDHVALKKNQGAAMENWGLITFKEDNILPQKTQFQHRLLKDKLVQSHEISHQWFGNLVSPEWWTYVWMNEGFATYFSYVITDMLYPEKHVMDIFLSDEAEHAYSYSSFFDARPMTSYVETEADIMSVFDIISYKRSACVIKMFHHAFNQKTFVDGISRYLKKFQYSVVNELDLFDVIQTAVQEDKQFQQQPWSHKVRDIMLSWTHSEWLPIVSVIRNYENNTITFRQQSIHSKTEHWWIPLNFAYSQSPSFEATHVDYFMPPLEETTLSLDELQLQLSGRDWLIVNKQQTGFYHVHYDTDNLFAISRQLQLNHTIIHPINRATIFRDLAPIIERNEMESIEVIFEMFKYLEYEEHLMPWKQVQNVIEYLFSNLYGTASYSLFKQFVRRLISPTFQRLFSNNDSATTHLNMMTQSGIIELACRADLPECLDYTNRKAQDYIFRRIELDHGYPDYYGMHDTVLCMGLRYQTDEDFMKIVDLLKVTERDSVYFDDIIFSLRCIQNHRQVKHYLNVLLGANASYLIMNEKDSMMYFSYVFKSSMLARPIIWSFIDNNYKSLCHSANFVQLLNDIAEYVPEHRKSHFAMLRQNIETYMKQEQLSSKVPLIDRDSSRIGKKMRNIEQFLDKFEHQIHNWLLKDLPESNSDDVLAASLSVGNGSSRPEGLWHTVGNLVKSVLSV